MSWRIKYDEYVRRHCVERGMIYPSKFGKAFRGRIAMNAGILQHTMNKLKVSDIEKEHGDYLLNQVPRVSDKEGEDFMVMFRRWYGDVDMEFEGEAEDLDDPNDLEFAFNRMRRQQGIVPFPRFDDEPQTADEQTPHKKNTINCSSNS